MHVYYYNTHCILTGMGEKFRELYGEVACIRSLLPSDTPVATAQVRSAIIKNLHMKNELCVYRVTDLIYATP